MGLLDSLIGTTVLKYKADVEQAKAKVKELAGEQKKAAKEQAEALEKQGKAAESSAMQYAKGAAIIVAGYAVLKTSLDSYHERQTMIAASTTINLKRLDEAAGGLKTKMELLTLATAGSQGAWKLTTDQMVIVTEGMRALEKKGFDATEVTNELTKAIKEGKINGLDKFGLGLKSTGDAAADLKLLLHALRGEVKDLGGDLSKSGDEAKRTSTNLRGAVDELKNYIGMEAEREAGLARKGGQIAAALLKRDLSGLNGDSSITEGVNLGTTQGLRALRREEAAQAERDSADTIRNLFRMGNAASAAIKAEDEVAKQVMADYDAGVTLRKERAKDYLAAKKDRAESDRILASLGLGPPSVRADGEARAYADYQAQIERDVNASDAQEAAVRGVKDEQNRLAAASSEAQRALAEDRQGKQKSHLERMFGPIEEFDAYEEGFRTLTDAVKASGDAILDSVIKGEKITKASAGRAVGAILGAESHKLWGQGLSTFLSSIYPTNPAGLAAGAGMMAGGFVLGKIASQFGGKGVSGGGAGARSGSQDHRGMGSGHNALGGGTGTTTIVAIGDGWSDNSPRFAAAGFRRMIERSNAYAPAEGIRHG